MPSHLWIWLWLLIFGPLTAVSDFPMSGAHWEDGKPLPKTPLLHCQPLDYDLPEGKTATRKPWRPVPLRRPFLAMLITATCGLIATIQWIHFVSGRDQGVLFAESINKISIRSSFCYLYLPTIISVLYSFLWTWVDLDVKRLEPYFQLSRTDGAAGRDSVLLNYPLEFLLTLPFTAFRRRHWTVLSVSMTMILIFWGLTPLQAGIFAVRTLTVQNDVPGYYSTGYTAISEQGNLSASYAQSVYNIAWLNETLPQFMTKDYVLSPFGPSEVFKANSSNATYSGLTNLYSIDISCEKPFLWNDSAGIVSYNSSKGCRFYPPPYRPQVNNDTSKPFDTMYLGYQNQDGMADYYLSSRCDESFLHSFFVRWSKLPASAIDLGYEGGTIDAGLANATALFCEPSYYQQKVNATVDLHSKAVIDVQAVSEKSSIPNDLFNTSTFEWTMSSGMMQTRQRDYYPTFGFPDQKAHLVNMPLNLAYIPRMAPFAIATYRRPLEDYLDPDVLRLSYQAAYRLLFARQLVEILSDDKSSVASSEGQQSYRIQAVVVVPAFAWGVTALLMVLLAMAVSLFIHTPRRTNNMQKDPSTIGRLMELMSGDRIAATPFAEHDSSPSDILATAVGSTTFKLEASDNDSSNSFIRRYKTSVNLLPRPANHSPNVRGIRPAEMRVYIGVLFLVLQLAASITFFVLYLKAKSEKGLPLPSNSTFVRQLVENYVPIALATFIEPFWLILNRFICLLQPFEELRKGTVAASRSVELDYSSLPPQLLFVRAIRARHLMLALVCFMVLSANGLAVALSGLMYEGSEEIGSVALLPTLKLSQFRSLNGTGLPFNSDLAQAQDGGQGGTTSDPFYRQMSNLTASTPLPPWTDAQFAYVPLNILQVNETATIQLTTVAFGAELRCEQLSRTGTQNYTLDFSNDASAATLSVSLQRVDGTALTCNADSYLSDSQAGHVALELGAMLKSNSSKPNADDDFQCRQHILAGWIRADWRSLGQDPKKNVELLEPTSVNETILLCTPTVVAGPAEILVNHIGEVRKTMSANVSSSAIEHHFTSRPADLIAQANQFIVDGGSTWHTDKFPSDFVNYLIKESTNDTSLLDASLPIPSFDHASKHLASIYERLFAILIGTNTDILLENTTPDDEQTKTAQVFVSQTRILISTPAFAVVEAILVCYILTTVFFYARRPWRVLPRLPGTLASNIAFFAASRALQELSSLQKMDPGDTEKVRATWKWSYGNFTGSDGRRHRGIEREQLVTLLEKDSLSPKASVQEND